MTKHESWNELLAELQVTYLRVLEDRIQIIKSLSEKLDWTLTQEEYHKLKGTGMTYGFPEISRLCEFMEFLCMDPSRRKSEHLTAGLDLLSYLLTTYRNGAVPDLDSQSAAQILSGLGAN